MTTYYYGIVEFGDFKKGDDSYPLAIIHRVNEVKEFDAPAQAWDHYINSNGEHESYVGVDAKDESNVQYELVFKQHK
jgi:hypothetical protein